MDDRRPLFAFLAVLTFAAVYVGFGFLYALDKRETNNALYEVFRGKVHAAEQVQGPRQLLVGGSNVVWGMRSQIIEDVSGVPTFNLALTHEAYDPKVMRALALSAVRPGDTVLYSSVSFWNARSIDPPAAAELLRVAGLAPDESSRLTVIRQTLDRLWSPYPQKSTMITALPHLYRRYIRYDPSPHGLDLNAKGDFANCTTPGAAGPNGSNTPADQELFIQQLQDFEEDLHGRGATLVLLFPPNLVLAEEKALWIENYTPLLDAMKKRFTLAQNAIEESLYTEGRAFCDTGYHLSNEEAALRSLRVGQFLKSYALRKPFPRS